MRSRTRTLARSILRSEMKCASYLDYITVEPSERQRQKHPSSVRALSEMPDEIGIGMILPMNYWIIYHLISFNLKKTEPG